MANTINQCFSSVHSSRELVVTHLSASHHPEGPVEESEFEIDVKIWEKKYIIFLLHKSVPENRGLKLVLLKLLN